MSWLSWNWHWVVILLFVSGIFLLTRFSALAGASSYAAQVSTGMHRRGLCTDF